MKITVEELLNLSGGVLLTENCNRKIKSVIIDSRIPSSNSLFVPLKGENHDGHDFIESAVKNGSKCVFVENEKYIDKNLDCEFILQKDNLKALQQLATNYRKCLNIEVIAITGSNGKTTTKDLIYSIFAKKYNTFKTQGNFNNEIGLPIMLTRLESSHEVAVLELGMSNFGEIDFLANISKPDVGIITNIGESHIEFLKTREGIAKAKGELLYNVDVEGKAILNGDDPYLQKMKNIHSNSWLYGFGKHNHLYAYDLKQTNEGVEFTVNGLGKNFSVWLPMLGKHNVSNALAAILCALLHGLTEHEIKLGLNRLDMTGMRTEIIQSKNKKVKIISDCYNSSLTSTIAAINVLNDFKHSGRKIAVVGDMLELGDISKKAHIEAGEKVGESKVDMLIAIGRYAEDLAQGFNNKRGEKTLVFNETDYLLTKIKKYLREGDLILVKGSRGLKLERVVNFLREEF
ncbi:UDP-N-acetylmuramoyl-tripeptide--D-alanyl-D-alanine ligase [Proteinivorax tanatarense]|uniref:UDP-N-acetylmuramoyl-tripeptide--D-alanyl-D-alanine ligase n=1 Tax=Proteinivorax tanatarense TaxID=1260629 RepID=A0AAU7VQK2_9FIRM